MLSHFLSVYTGQKMVLGRNRHLLLSLFVAALPLAILADGCTSSSESSVRLSASCYRNMSGHWIAEASLIRRSSRDGSDVRNEERPWHYDVDIIRKSCRDDETMTTTFHVVAPPARVGADYTFFPNIGFYKFHTDRMNWKDALRTCAGEGAHLAIINSAAEEKAIVELMKPHNDQGLRPFIGFHDRFTEGQYVTIFGQKLNSTGHVRWGPGQPSNTVFSGFPEGEDCGDIFSDGTLNDVRCSNVQPFVCEQSL